MRYRLLELRIPRWCTGASVSVAGESEARPAAPGSAYRVSRRWLRGNRLELRLPMAPRFVAGRRAQAGRVAVMRGPQVFCLGRRRTSGLDGKDLRLLVVEPGTLGEAAPDGSLRQDGRVISLRAWSPGAWYPVAPSDLSLVLTEFADPDGELVYLKAPVPGDRRFQPDELMTSGSDGGRRGIAEGFYADVLEEDLADRESAETLRRLQS